MLRLDKECLDSGSRVGGVDLPLSYLLGCELGLMTNLSWYQSQIYWVAPLHCMRLVNMLTVFEYHVRPDKECLNPGVKGELMMMIPPG